MAERKKKTQKKVTQHHIKGFSSTLDHIIGETFEFLEHAIERAIDLMKDDNCSAEEIKIYNNEGELVQVITHKRNHHHKSKKKHHHHHHHHHDDDCYA